jgi:signal transduction histidine kinase
MMMTGTADTDLYAAFLHELNQPVTTLRNVLELTTYRETNDWPAVVEAAMANVDRMVELLDLMGELTRAERTPAAPEPVDIAEVLREAVNDLGAPAKDEERLLVGEGIDTARLVSAVPESLRSAIFRLLTDAIHQTQAGGAVKVALQSGPEAVVAEIAYPMAAFAENEGQALLALAQTGRGPRGSITRRVFRLALSLRVLVLQGARLELCPAPASRLRLIYRQNSQISSQAK